MINHYLKVALRNLWKYKWQSVISIVGLAVGFVCFALATLWIRYERTHDAFHPDADRIFMLVMDDSKQFPRSTKDYLRENYPEIELVVVQNKQGVSLFSDTDKERVFQTTCILVDEHFLEMYPLELVAGSFKFISAGDTKGYAISEEVAQELFPDGDPIGQPLCGNRNTVEAIFKSWSKPSNFTFDCLAQSSGSLRFREVEYHDSYITFKLKKGIDVEAFSRKLKEDKRIHRKPVSIVPITLLRYTNPINDSIIKYSHVQLFAIAGLLLIVCSLFNYFTLFVSRFRIRRKEFALRQVNGSSLSFLFGLLSIELLITLLLASTFGLAFIQLSIDTFREYSLVKLPLSAIYGEAIVYLLAIVLISLLIFFLVLKIYHRRSLNTSIRRKNNDLSRKLSIVAQLVISIGFLFCSVLMIKQLYFLHHTDLGFDYKNTVEVEVYYTQTDLIDKLKQLPGIETVVQAESLFRPRAVRSTEVTTIEDDKEVSYKYYTYAVTLDNMRFHNFRLLEGNLLTDADNDGDALVTETVIRANNLIDPIGQQLYGYTIKGVVKDLHRGHPTEKPLPIIIPKTELREPEIEHGEYTQEDGSTVSYTSGDIFSKFLIRYTPDENGEVEKQLRNTMQELDLRYTFGEETYDDYFRSEDALMKLITAIALVCMLVCVFGFVSIISLDCQERRKEIAVRKVNGATDDDIVGIFFKQYFGLLLIGTVIAFPISYYVMKGWIEQYTLQTSIPVWLYLSIFVCLLAVIVVCVGWRVYRTSRENPADVLKSE